MKFRYVMAITIAAALAIGLQIYAQKDRSTVSPGQIFAGPTYTVPTGVSVKVESPFVTTDAETRCDNWPRTPTKLPCHVELHAVANDSARSSQPPSVTITNPLNGATFKAGEQINLSVNASDPDGFVVGIDYVANDLLWWTNGAIGGSQGWALQKWVFTLPAPSPTPTATPCARRLPNGKCAKK
jgi:hypothetical protein